MKHLIIFNACSNEGKSSQHLEDIKKAFENLDYELHITAAPREAVTFVKNYLANHQDDTVRVYACGGDGTLSEVANALVGYSNAELALYAIGTGNDFAKYYGGAEHFQDLSKLINGKAYPIDLSKISGGNLEEAWYSINVINFGFDAIVGAVGNKNKLKGKKNPYNKAMVTAIFKGRFNRIQVLADGKQLNKKKMLLCTLAQGHYVGGQFMCSPKSDNTDGLIDVCLVHTRSLFGFLKILKPYTNGQHLDDEKINKTLEYVKAKKISIESLTKKDVDICVDGEMTSGHHFEVEVVPQAIKFVIPE